MDLYQNELYQRIQAFSLDDANSNYPFSRKLAEENNWTDSYTQLAIQEYKKFVFLAVAAGHEVSPSEVIDKVWHLHLIYTQSYWEEFCPNVLGISLHHNPSKGGVTEQQKYNNLFQKTLESYQSFFGQTPPSDFWQDPYSEQSKEIGRNTLLWKKILALFFIPVFFAGGKVLTENSNSINQAHATKSSLNPIKDSKSTSKKIVRINKRNTGCGNGCGNGCGSKGCGTR